MKKLFTLLTSVLFATSMWGEIANPYSFTFEKSDLTTSSTSFTKGGVTWSLSDTENSWSGTENKTGFVFGSAGSPKTLTISTSGIVGTITSISVIGRSNNNGKVATVSVVVGSSDFTSADNTWDNGNNQTLTFTGSASGAIAVTITPDACGYVLNGISVSYTTGGTPTCETPTFSPVAGAVLSGTTVTISSATEGATIYYTMGATPADPTTGSDQYTGPIQITEATTIKAIAVKNDYNNSVVGTAAYTIATPLATMDEIFNAATSTATNKFITFNNWVVSGKTTNTAYVTDGEKGFVININNHGYSVGDILSGTANVSLKLTNGRATISAVSGTITKTEGGVITPVVVDINDLSGVNTGAPITVQNVIYDGTNLVDASSNKIQPYNSLYSATFETAKTYNVTGIYLQYNSTKEILPRTADDIEEAAVQIPVVYLNPTSINVAATNVANQSVKLIHSLTSVSSVITGLYSDEECNTEITSGEWIKNITSNIGEKTITFNVDDNAGLKRTCYMKITVSDGTSIVSAVLPITQAKSDGPASLPFSFDGGKSDIESIIGLSQSGLGSDYTDSPKLKFDGTKDSLLLKINETPGTLSFDIVGKSFSEGTFKVQTSADGVAYTDLKSYTELTSATLNESFNNLASTVRYIKWIYTNKVNGNVALGNIDLKEPATPPTALEDVDSSVKAVKVLRNGQLFIEKAGKVYTITGQLVK